MKHIHPTTMLSHRLALTLGLLVIVTCCTKNDPKPLPAATFTFAVGANGHVTFTNTSANATTYSWEFGDGETSVAKSPAHTFPNNGGYMVTLTVVGDGGTNMTSHDIVINDISQIGTWTFKDLQISNCADPANNQSLLTCTTACTTVIITATKLTSKNTGQADIVFDYTMSGDLMTLSGVSVPFLVNATSTTLTLTQQQPNSGNNANCLEVDHFTRM